MGLNSAVTYLAVFLGTTGFGPLYARFGFAAAASVAAGLTLVAVLLVVFAKQVVHPERSGKNGVATHPFNSEETPDEAPS